RVGRCGEDCQVATGFRVAAPCPENPPRRRLPMSSVKNSLVVFAWPPLKSKGDLGMSVSDEERLDAERTGELVRKKLMEIMDLQADIDALLRDTHPSPFGSKNWEFACPEALQRLV